MDLLDKTKARPVISEVSQSLSLNEVDQLFAEIKKGAQFGELIVEIPKSASTSKRAQQALARLQ